MARVVLDASALLALLQGEPGAGEIEGLLPGAVLGAVNYAEAAGKLLEAGVPEAAARGAIDGLGLEVLPFDEGMALRAARLRIPTRGAGLSLGDRACLALAGSLGVPAVTTDRAWKGIDAGVKVRVVPRR